MQVFGMWEEAGGLVVTGRLAAADLSSSGMQTCINQQEPSSDGDNEPHI